MNAKNGMIFQQTDGNIISINLKMPTAPAEISHHGHQLIQCFDFTSNFQDSLSNYSITIETLEGLARGALKLSDIDDWWAWNSWTQFGFHWFTFCPGSFTWRHFGNMLLTLFCSCDMKLKLYSGPTLGSLHLSKWNYCRISQKNAKFCNFLFLSVK